MDSVLSNWAGNLALKTLLSVKGLYLALHLEVPPPDGTGEEVRTGGYARAKISFTANPGNKTVANTIAVAFKGMPAVTVKAMTVWTAVSGGNMIVTWLLVPVLSVPESGQLLCAVGDLAVSL